MNRLHFNPHTGQLTAGQSKSARNTELDRVRGRNLSSLNRARKLAESHGIQVEKDSAGGWWVTCSRFKQEADPLQGNQFCESGAEVLETVEAYVGELAKLESPHSCEASCPCSAPERAA